MEEEKSYQKIVTEFSCKFRTDFYPNLKNFIYKKNTNDFYDKKTHIIFKLLLVLFLLIVIIGSCVSIFYTKAPILFAISANFLLAFFIVMLLYSVMRNKKIIISQQKAKIFSKNMKEKIIPEFCKCFPSLMWTQNKKYLNSDYCNTGLPIKGLLDDSFLGYYKKIMFTIDEFIVEDRVYSHFLLIKLGINKNFKGHTVICPKGTKPTINDLHYTQMEDLSFARKYDVYTNDDVEARYLITPTFIEKFNKIENIYKAIYTYGAFYKEKFYIFFKIQKDIFEINNKDEIFNENTYLEIFGEISAIYQLIDHFKLNQNIGM